MSALHDSTNVVSPGGARKRQRVAGSFLDILEEAGVSFDDEGSSETTGASRGKRSHAGRGARQDAGTWRSRRPGARVKAPPRAWVLRRECVLFCRKCVVRVIVRRLPSPPRCPSSPYPHATHRLHTPPAHPPPSPSSSHLPSARSFTGLRTSHASLFASPRPRLQDGLAST